MKYLNLIIGNRLLEPETPAGTTIPAKVPDPGSLENDFSKPQTADDYDAILNELDDKTSTAPVTAPEVDTPTTDTAKLDAQIEEAGNKIATDPNAPPPATTPPAVAPSTDTPPATGNGLVTDEFINALPEEDRRYVEKFKGQSIAELAKSFANQAKLLGKKKEELIPVTAPEGTPQTIPQTTPQPVAPTTDAPENLAKAQEIREKLIIEDIVEKLPFLKENPPPNLDENSPEFIEWYRDLNYNAPHQMRKFENALSGATSLVDGVFKEHDNIVKNFGSINKQKVDADVKFINDYFANELKIDPKTIGFDLTIADDGSNPLIDGLLFNQGALDQSLIETKFGKPIVRDGEIARKFFQVNLPAITKKIQELARIDGVNAALPRTAIPTKEVPSIASAPGGMQKKELTVKDVANITDAKTIDEILDESDREAQKNF